MPQIDNFSVQNFQRDVFSVFDKYGMGINDALRLLSNRNIDKYANPIRSDELKKSFIELKKIQAECHENGEYKISDEVVKNAQKVLTAIVSADIGMKIPMFSANPMEQIGFTWDAQQHRVSLGVDSDAMLYLTIIEKSMPHKYLYMQSDLDNIHDVLTKIREVIERDNLDFERHVSARSSLEKQVFATLLALHCEAIIRE
ncbi:MAG: hypothetical protein LBN20_06030 [Endomicrobium sp.]|jgi:hypothetical protein|nr:hypothetical protein [Endomicrobium sp.]